MSAPNIRREAIKAFARYGYHGASLRQIATASEITLGTLYHYYPSKQDLLAELMRDALQPLITSVHRVRDEFPGDPTNQLVEAVRQFVHITLADPQLAIIADVELRSLTGENASSVLKMRDEYEDVIRAIVTEGAESGAFEPDDVQIATFAVLAISNQPAYWFTDQGRLSASSIADAQAMLALRLVAARSV